MQIEISPSPIPELIEYFKKDIGAYLYVLGELNNRFKENTTWYAVIKNGEIKAVALLNKSREKPLFICLNSEEQNLSAALTAEIIIDLPPIFNAHLGKGILENDLSWKVEKDYAIYLSMLLMKAVAFQNIGSIKTLGIENLDAAQDLFNTSYPGNWFKPEKLESGYYLGYFHNEKLIGLAGTNLLSKEYSLALLANICVKDEYRGKGIARILTSQLCFDLSKQYAYIGMDVHAGNAAAIRTYKSIGFETVNQYRYCVIETQSNKHV
jgi:GNAT superfamily N-acetyltransferase